jgi:branched-subunit amino acid aminotransferase/4-amino-4-deoxychorismate lyase
LEVPYSDNEIALALQELIGQENIERGMARVTVTARGDGRWLEQTGCDLSIAVKDLSTTSDSLAPLKLILSQFRVDARRATSGIKSSSYADYQLAWRNAHHAGFDEAVLCNSAGALCEGTRSNIFWARGGTLYTPSLDCGPLPGIARALILEWARDEGTIVREGAFAPMEFGSADEVFTTSSTFGPRPVGSIGDDNFVSPGEITQRLMERWDLEVLSI